MSEPSHQASFEQLLQRNRVRIAAIAQAYSRADADDFIQEILLQIWRGLENFEQRSHVDTWCYRVALNTALVVLHAIRVYHPSRSDLAVNKFCQAEIDRVDCQIFLLRNVSWWYTGPLLSGCCLIAFGNSSPLSATFTSILYIGLGVLIHWLNQLAIRSQLLPLRQELVSISETFLEELSVDSCGEEE